MSTLVKLRQAFQSVLDNRLRTGSDASDLLSLGAAIGELAHVNTGWTVELRYPHWEEPHYERREEKEARTLARIHRDRGAKVRLLSQEFYAGSQVEEEL